MTLSLDANPASLARSARRLYAYSGGFCQNARLRRIMELAGLPISIGRPGPGDRVAVWGQRRVAWRGRWVARQCGADVLTVEDGFLRSLTPACAPLSLVIDDLGIYFDATRPSRLEAMIRAAPKDPSRDRRASEAMAVLRDRGLSKYTATPRKNLSLSKGYLLIVDQIKGDASILGAKASAATFQEMLQTARRDAQGRPILIRAHPATHLSGKSGHFRAEDLLPGEQLLTDPINPWDLLESAARVYTVSSQMGFEALIAGKPVTCFGLPFYAGWGLSEDRLACPRRGVPRSLEQVFAAAYFDYPVYYDPLTDQLTDFETTAANLQRAQSWDAGPLVLSGIRAWKRKACLKFAGPQRGPAGFEARFDQALTRARRENKSLWIWASKAPEDALDQAKAASVQARMIEDGFLRSNGLGAALVPPASLVVDDLGIYFDPTRPSRLETLIRDAAALPAASPEIARARALIQRVIETQVTKYNTGRHLRLDRSDGRAVVLVPGQVEDDASLIRGRGAVSTNLGLIETARAQNPSARILYKPHPDVEAGLRPGAVSTTLLKEVEIVSGAASGPLLSQVDAVWTMTSLMGFEALLRGLPVTCLGMPFYAGWGLTTDHMTCPRRQARPSLEALVHAALIAYPRYVDPISGWPCEAEHVVDRLAHGQATRTPWQTALARLQGWAAGQGAIPWR